MKITTQLAMLLAAAGLLALPSLARAGGTVIINFNTVQEGTVINTTYSPQGVSFAGESPFSQQVQATTDGGAFTTNALDATPGVVDLLLDPGIFSNGLQSFQFTSLADPAGYGSPSVALDFYDANGSLLFSSPTYDQTQTQTLTFNNLQGVQKIVLPADAYYDDIQLQPNDASPAPEPSQTAVLGIVLAGMAGLIVRKRILVKTRA